MKWPILGSLLACTLLIAAGEVGAKNCGDDVGGRVGQRHRLRGADDGGRVRDGGTQLVEHLGERLHRHDVMTERGERARELAGSGAEVDDVARCRAREPKHRVGRVPGPRPLVRIRHPGERGRALRSHRHRAYSACSGSSRRRAIGVGRSMSAPSNAPAAPIQSVGRRPIVLPSRPPSSAPTTRTP